MAVRLKAQRSRKKASLELPISFFDYFLPKTNGDYLKVYLYGLKACVEKKHVTDIEIAETLGMQLNDISNAWSYWENEGMISASNGMVEFENPKDMDFSGDDKKKNNEGFGTVVEEIESNKEFREIIRTIEAIYPRLLSQNDALTLYDIVITQGISVDLFLITAAHCFSMKKTNFNYIAKVLTETYKKGFTTSETMEHHYSSLVEAANLYGKVKKILKIYNRDLIDKEKEFIDKWIGLGKTDEELKEAFEKTILNTGKLSLPYMDKILTGEKGNNKKTTSSVKPGPLNNFQQEMPDFKKIEEILLEKQKKF